MPVCGKGQTPNNERETKTILDCFSPDWIWYVRHAQKKHMDTVTVGVWPLTQELPAKKGGKDN